MQQLLGCEWVQAELMRDVRMPIEVGCVARQLFKTKTFFDSLFRCSTCSISKTIYYTLREKCQPNQGRAHPGQYANTTLM